MAAYLKCLVDAVVDAKAEPDFYMPLLATLAVEPVFTQLPEEVVEEVQGFIKEPRRATPKLTEYWTHVFKEIESGKGEGWHPTTPPESMTLRSDRLHDWNQVFQFNELAVALGGEMDEGLLVRDHLILDLSMESVVLQLRRLIGDMDKIGFRPGAVLAHDRESVPPALALAGRYDCGLEPEDALGKDCVYLIGNLRYAGALERARAMLEGFPPARCLIVALLLTEDPNALRLIPDIIGYQVGSGALPWGKPAGVGVLLSGLGEEDAVADRDRFDEERDARNLEEIGQELSAFLDEVEKEDYEEHVMYCSGAVQRILSRKKESIRPFGWRILDASEEAGEWHSLLPPFPYLFGTPFSELPAKPTMEQLQALDREAEQLQFMDWVDDVLQHPNEVWIKQDVRGNQYTHYFAVIRKEGLALPAAFVVETVPYGDELALNNYCLFLDPADAEELRFGVLVHQRERPSLN